MVAIVDVGFKLFSGPRGTTLYWAAVCGKLEEHGKGWVLGGSVAVKHKVVRLQGRTLTLGICEGWFSGFRRVGWLWGAGGGWSGCCGCWLVCCCLECGWW